MAESVKVQGTYSGCLEVLQIHANKFNVRYMVSFGTDPRKMAVKPENDIYDRTIYFHFTWNHKYGEYDNSVF